MAEHAPHDSPVLAGVDPLIGSEVGGAYRIVRLIGAGGMGSVYEAKHLRLNRRCAVKVLNHDLQHDPTYLERFRREAEVTSRLRNRHICEVLDFNHLPDGSPYLAMEYLEGEDLASRIKKRPLTPKELAPLLDGVGSALAAAHKIGVLHRDIKPANILVGEDGRPVLIDFGSARFESGDATSTKVTFHTPPYAAIEQYVRTYEQGPWTDVYALGVVLYECITGEKPPEVLERMHGGLGKALTDGEWPGYSRPFLAAVDAAMGIRPSDRPQSISQWLALFDASGETPDAAAPAPDDRSGASPRSRSRSSGAADCSPGR